MNAAELGYRYAFLKLAAEAEEKDDKKKDKPKEKKKGLSTGAKVGIGAGVLGAGALGAYYLSRKNKDGGNKGPAGGSTEGGDGGGGGSGSSEEPTSARQTPTNAPAMGRAAPPQPRLQPFMGDDYGNTELMGSVGGTGGLIAGLLTAIKANRNPGVGGLRAVGNILAQGAAGLGLGAGSGAAFGGGLDLMQGRQWK